MPAMSHRAYCICLSRPWRLFAGRVVLPWALQGHALRGDVLEIGCGSGAMAEAALRKFPGICLTATDFDESMVEVAQKRLSAFGPRVEVRQADAIALPFADTSFDAVVSFIMLHHVLEWEQALAEITRVLRPGGTLLGYDLIGGGTGRVMNGHEHHTRRMQEGELGQALDGLPFDGVITKSALGGRLSRFIAQKS